MSGCSFPWSATVTFCSALSLFTYCRSIVTFGICASNFWTMSWIDRYSCDSLTGGGGVYPIHIVRCTGAPVAPDPVAVGLDVLLEHAVATSAIAKGSVIHIRFRRSIP